MFILYNIILSLVILKTNADDVVSNEYKEQGVRKEKNTYNKMERRFMVDMDDREWHVSHLKDTDFADKRENCEDTFDDKLRSYRRAMQNDASLIEFVSSDALPFDVKDLKKPVCKAPDKKANTTKGPDKEKTLKAPEPEKNTEKSTVVTKGKVDKKDEMEKLNVATTTTKKSKGSGEVRKGASGEAKKAARRANDYLFSSIEYYDDPPVFDDTRCPDDVEVIDLEIDHIRNYDLRCEQVLMWKVLE